MSLIYVDINKRSYKFFIRQIVSIPLLILINILILPTFDMRSAMNEYVWEKKKKGSIIMMIIMISIMIIIIYIPCLFIAEAIFCLLVTDVSSFILTFVYYLLLEFLLFAFSLQHRVIWIFYVIKTVSANNKNSSSLKIGSL